MCKHKKICVECTREEIAKLKKQIDELESKLPQRDVLIIQTSPLQPYIQQVPYIPPMPSPQWYCTSTSDNSTVTYSQPQ